MLGRLGISLRFTILTLMYFVTIICKLSHVDAKSASDECDRESILSEIGDNPILRELYKGESVHKCNEALTRGYLRTAKVYWNEVACIEATNKKSGAGAAGTSETVRLLSSLKHIIRDHVAMVLVPGSIYLTCNIRMLLDLMQHTNITGVQPYEFLLNEFQTYPELMYHRDNLVFELGLEIKTKFGSEAPIFKALPIAVQHILASKQVKLQNAATKQYLAFREFNPEEDEKSQPYVNAVVVPSLASEKSTAWTFLSSSVEPGWDADYPSYSSISPVYQAQIKSSMKCARTNCTTLLSENDTKTHDLVLSTASNYVAHIINGQSQDLTLQLASDNSVLIKRRRPNEMYRAMALTESVSGGLRYLPESFYYFIENSIVEFFELDPEFEIVNRTAEERVNDVLRNEWIVSLA